MSRFVRALEQAERDRALLEQRVPGEAPEAPADIAAIPEAEPVEEGSDRSANPRLPGETEGVGSDPGLAWSRGLAAEPERDGSRAHAPEGVDERFVSLLAPASFAAEQYRSIRSLLEQLRRTARVSVVGVTSPIVGDGKTVTAVNLAGALAQAPAARILLVEADLRRPTLGQSLALLEQRPGLVELILDQRLKLARGVVACPPFGLAVLPAGQTATTPYEILKSPRLAELLGEARETYDYVVVDCPPLVPVPDCRAISRCVDGFLVVVAAHRTPRGLLEEGLRVVDPPQLLGLVFNEDDHSNSRYYGQRPSPSDRSRGIDLQRRPRRWLRW